MVEDSVLWEGSRIGRGCVIRRSIVAGAVLPAGARRRERDRDAGAARTDRAAGALGPMRHHVPKKARAAVAPRRRVTRSTEEGFDAAVRRFLRSRWGARAEVARISPLAGDASTRRYYRVLRGARDAAWSRSTRSRSTPRARPSSSCTGCSRAGACRCRASSTVDGAQGVVLAGGPGRRDAAGRARTATSATQQRDLYRQALDQLVRLQREAAAGPAGRVLLPDRVRLREAVVGAALLLEALPGGVPRLRPVGRGPRARSRTASTGWRRRSRPGRACCATATSTAAT